MRMMQVPIILILIYIRINSLFINWLQSLIMTLHLISYHNLLLLLRQHLQAIILKTTLLTFNSNMPRWIKSNKQIQAVITNFIPMKNVPILLWYRQAIEVKYLTFLLLLQIFPQTILLIELILHSNYTEHSKLKTLYFRVAAIIFKVILKWHLLHIHKVQIRKIMFR